VRKKCPKELKPNPPRRTSVKKGFRKSPGRLLKNPVGKNPQIFGVKKKNGKNFPL